MAEGQKIIEKCHAAPYGGHYGVFRTQAKIWQSGFYWPSMYEDTKNFIRRCPNCQRHGGIIARDSMPLNYNLQVELFDVRGIDYMGPFVRSQGCEYILVALEYVSKWVEAMPCVAEPPKITWISALTIVAKATLIQLARTSAVPRVKSRLKPQKTGIE